MEAEAVIDQPTRLERSVQRDASLAALYRQEYAPMVRLAHLITGSNEVAEDVVQDAFVRMYRNWDRADQPGAYLRTIVVTAAEPGTAAGGWSASAYPGRGSQGIDAEVHELLDALAHLGIRQRTALVLRFYVDMSEADVAHALRSRPGTVKSLVHRGLRQLEEVMER